MKPDKKILDDVARVADGAAHLLSGIQQQVREEARARIDDLLARMDFVSRAEFDALSARVEALEKAQKPAAKTAAKKSTAKKPAAKKAPAKKPAAKTTTAGKAKK